jgi:putative oxidoreductase
MERTFDRHWALPLRIMLGIVFIVHGAPKLFNAQAHQQFEGMLGKLGVPLPSLMSWVVGIVEFFGGIALIVGFLTWIATALLVVDMLVATFTVHLPRGFSVMSGGVEFPLLILAGLLALFIGGPGPLSVDERAARPESRLRAPWGRHRHAHV